MRSRIASIFVLSTLLALPLAACSPASPDSQTPEPAPAVEHQVESHAPVILRVDERQTVINGVQVYNRDLYFNDPDGDADYISVEEISSSLAYPSDISRSEIDTPSQEQVAGAMIPLHWYCTKKLDIVLEIRISDRLGNQSEPVQMAFSCSTPPLVDTRSYLIKGISTAIPIALVLLLGLWLFFRKTPSERVPALRSMLLLFSLLLVLRFVYLVMHEGGHCLYNAANDLPVTLYVHPFLISGYCRPATDNNWSDLLGSLVALPLAALISLPFWKRRSLNLLPLVMLFPFAAGLHVGVGVMGFEGDFKNIVQGNGFSPVPFYVLGASITAVGILMLFSAFPLLGLGLKDKKALFVLPAAFFLQSALAFLVAAIFVPGSPIDREYFLGKEILAQANSFIVQTVIGLALAGIYLTLYRKIASRLPAWLRTETVSVSWKNLRLPAMLAAVSVVLGLIIII